MHKQVIQSQDLLENVPKITLHWSGQWSFVLVSVPYSGQESWWLGNTSVSRQCNRCCVEVVAVSKPWKFFFSGEEFRRWLTQPQQWVQMEPLAHTPTILLKRWRKPRQRLKASTRTWSVSTRNDKTGLVEEIQFVNCTVSLCAEGTFQNYSARTLSQTTVFCTLQLIYSILVTDGKFWKWIWNSKVWPKKRFVCYYISCDSFRHSC